MGPQARFIEQRLKEFAQKNTVKRGHPQVIEPSESVRGLDISGEVPSYADLRAVDPTVDRIDSAVLPEAEFDLPSIARQVEAPNTGGVASLPTPVVAPAPAPATRVPPSSEPVNPLLDDDEGMPAEPADKKPRVEV